MLNIVQPMFFWIYLFPTCFDLFVKMLNIRVTIVFTNNIVFISYFWVYKAVVKKIMTLKRLKKEKVAKMGLIVCS